MPKSDRLFRLMQLMRTLPQPVKAADLAGRLEVSRRTLYRDIEGLRVAGARIEGETGVGYTLVEDIAMPPQTLTRLETEALAIGLAEVQFRGDAQLASAVDITAVREACWEERALHITYEDRKGAVTQRRIFPLAVLYFEYAVMLLAYCHLRDDYRSFHVTHIRGVQPLEESFRPHRVRLLNDYVVDLRRRLGERGEDLTVM